MSEVATPTILGLTGGIGAGKSTVTHHLIAAGIPVFDCDAEVRTLYRDLRFLSDAAAAADLSPADLGDAPQKTLSARIAADPALLDRLGAVTDRHLRLRLAHFTAEHQHGPLIVIDAPTLIERGWDALCDRTLCIIADTEVRLRRVLSRPGMTEEKFRAINARQVDDDTRRRACTDIIDGNQPPDDVRQAAMSVISKTLIER